MIPADLVARAETAETAITALREKVKEVVGPFADLADAMDDAAGLIDDEDRKEHVNIGFGGMTLGDVERDAFRAASQLITDLSGETL